MGEQCGPGMGSQTGAGSTWPRNSCVILPSDSSSPLLPHPSEGDNAHLTGLPEDPDEKMYHEMMLSTMLC